MARFYPTGGAGGGVSSSELTATKQFVLNGMTAVTKDSNDEAAVGTMPDYRNLTKESDSIWIDGDYVKMSIQDWGCYGAESSIRRPASELGDAESSHVLSGKTFTSSTGLKVAGAMGDKSGATQEATADLDTTNSRVRMSIPVRAAYNENSKLYATYATIRTLIGLTAAKIATGNTILGLAGTYKGLGNAGTGDVVAGKTFSTASLSNATGTLVDNSGTTKSAEASLDTTNSRVQLTVPATAKYSTTSKLYVAYATLASKIGLTAAKLISGNTILGIAGTATSTATISNANQLRKDVVAFGKNGTKYTGTMTEQAAKTWTPGPSAQTIAAGTYCSGVQTIAAIPSKYKDLTTGATVFSGGVWGVVELTKAYSPGGSSSDLSDLWSVGDVTVIYTDDVASMGATAVGTIKDITSDYFHMKPGRYKGAVASATKTIDMTYVNRIDITGYASSEDTSVRVAFLSPDKTKFYGPKSAAKTGKFLTNPSTVSIDTTDLKGHLFMIISCNGGNNTYGKDFYFQKIVLYS